MSKRATIVVNGQGYVFVGTVKVCKVVRQGKQVKILFHDKDKRRSGKRGSDQVETTLIELAKAVENGGG